MLAMPCEARRPSVLASQETMSSFTNIMDFSIKNALINWIAIFALVLGATLAFAQRDATSKITGEAYRVHAQSLYQNHAADHANLVYSYSKASAPVPKAAIQDHITAVQKNLDAAKAQLAQSKKTYKDDTTVQQLLASIEKHYAQCTDQCKSMSGDAALSDMKMVNSCCGMKCEEMQAAQADMDKLTQHLGIKKLEPMKPAAAK